MQHGSIKRLWWLFASGQENQQWPINVTLQDFTVALLQKTGPVVIVENFLALQASNTDRVSERVHWALAESISKVQVSLAAWDPASLSRVLLCVSLPKYSWGEEVEKFGKEKGWGQEADRALALAGRSPVTTERSSDIPTSVK
jgi:hypothetical protein